jgi:hypothetical protein
MRQQQNYSAISRDLLGKAQVALDQGDLVQASEKGWSAAAQMVKAIAEERGWPHDGDRSIYEVINRLLQETGDRELATLFHVAGSLRSNSYENWLPAEMVQSGLKHVQKFMNKLARLLA